MLIRKFKIFRSLGFRKSCYLIIYRFLYLFENFFQLFEDVQHEKRWHSKLLKLKENKAEVFTQELTSNEKNQIKEFYSKFGWDIKNDWHTLYFSVNGFFSEKYIPESLFYQAIEPTLNDFSKLGVYGDKNFYQKLYPKKYQPRTLFRSINDQLLADNYTKISHQLLSSFLKERAGKYVLKPSRNSYGGRNVFLVYIQDSRVIKDGKQLSFEELSKTFNGNYIVQEYINQHEDVNSLNPRSVNTVRVITLRFHGVIYLLSAFLRLGNGESFVDNMTNGGMGIGIQQNGDFTDFGINVLLEKVNNIPKAIKTSEIRSYPNFNKIEEAVSELHENVFDFDLISWDMLLDKNSAPIMIENNLRLQDVNIHQTLNGPLFGDMTDQVLEYVAAKHQK